MPDLALPPISIFRSDAIAVAGTNQTVTAEDFPSQELCDKAAQLAAKWLSMGISQDDAEAVITQMLGCNDGRPYGCTLIVEGTAE